MKLGRTALARVAVVALLAGSLLVVVAGPAHAGSLTPRTCRTTQANDRRLDVCARGWVNTGPTYTRGVVEMHTYAWQAGTQTWVDSTSQSITVNEGWVWRADQGAIAHFGNNVSSSTCRINGPSGTIGCSVPNTYRVAFYSAAINAPNWNPFQTEVGKVSWRDDRGTAHYVDWWTNNNQLWSPIWYA
jgi:hypothetical protein